MGRGGAGPFFFFHCPSVDALSGDNGVTTIDGPVADPVILELEGVMAEIEALLVDALKMKFSYIKSSFINDDEKIRHYPDLRIVKFLYLLDVILPLIIELESTSLVPADPILELFTTEV